MIGSKNGEAKEQKMKKMTGVATNKMTKKMYGKILYLQDQQNPGLMNTWGEIHTTTKNTVKVTCCSPCTRILT